VKQSAPPVDAPTALPRSFFLTGTDTGVGKTYVASLIVSARRKAGIDCIGLKPLCCGGRGDARVLYRANGGCLAMRDVNPWWFRAPAAPLIAARMENRVVPVDAIRAWGKRWAAEPRSVVIEGIGGWRVPIARDYAVSDLARDLNLPVVLVAANRLGVLNHVRLTLESIAATGARCAAVILNVPNKPARGIAGRVTATNRGVLESIDGMPRLFEITHRQIKLESLL
jgi:dethiobiotin synthetase